MNLIFDFDGTICDSLAIGVKLTNGFLASHHLPLVTADRIRKTGMKQLISEYRISLTELPKWIFLARSQMSEIIPSLKPFPHLMPVLRRLSTHYQLGILTTNNKHNVGLFLEKNHVTDLFSFVDDSPAFFGKHHKLKKYSQVAYYVGDETRDVEAAKKAKVKSVAVAWGFESATLLKRAQPDYLVNDPEDLLALIPRP